MCEHSTTVPNFLQPVPCKKSKSIIYLHQLRQKLQRGSIRHTWSWGQGWLRALVEEGLLLDCCLGSCTHPPHAQWRRGHQLACILDRWNHIIHIQYNVKTFFHMTIEQAQNEITTGKDMDQAAVVTPTPQQAVKETLSTWLCMRLTDDSMS